jgi:hypothetical protein
MAAKHKVFGPYRVKPHRVDGYAPEYEVVEMLDNTSQQSEGLRPRKAYTNRQPAYGKCLRLNREWQKIVTQTDDPDQQELLDYWQKATN